MDTMKRLKFGELIHENSTRQEIEDWQNSVYVVEKDKSKCGSRKGCTSQGGLRLALRPLAILAKIFGLFPCYDIGFSQNEKEWAGSKFRLAHALDYAYSGLLFLFLLCGSAYCTVYQPKIIALQAARKHYQDTDFVVVMASFYTSMGMGILSLFIFPRNYSLLLQFIDHFAALDKIFGFSACAEFGKERLFGKLVLGLFVGVGGLLGFMFTCMYVLELPGQLKGTSDYLMVPLLTVAAMVSITPNALLLFFLKAIQGRLVVFNVKMKVLVLPLIPSSEACSSFADYGHEVSQRKDSEDLGREFEKMRILHEELTQLVHEVNAVFGTHLLRDVIYSILSILMFSYFSLFLRREELVYWYSYPMLAVAVSIKLVMLTTYGEFIKTESAASLRVLHKACLLRLSPECSLQVQLLIKKLGEPLYMTACGYFHIDRKLLTSIVGSTTMLFIILIQFKVSAL